MSELIINTDSNVIEEADRKQKEQSQQSYTPKFKFDEKNYLTTRLNNGETEKEITVRILPISSTDGNIFLSLNHLPCYHFSFYKFSHSICLKPINTFFSSIKIGLLTSIPSLANKYNFSS